MPHSRAAAQVARALQRCSAAIRPILVSYSSPAASPLTLCTPQQGGTGACCTAAMQPSTAVYPSPAHPAARPTHLQWGGTWASPLCQSTSPPWPPRCRHQSASGPRTDAEASWCTRSQGGRRPCRWGQQSLCMGGCGWVVGGSVLAAAWGMQLSVSGCPCEAVAPVQGLLRRIWRGRG